MALNAEQLALLLQSISSFSATLKDKLAGKLAIDGTAVNSEKLGGQTLEEILTNLDAATKSELAAVVADFEAFMARTDNPHAVTKEQVGLGLVDNFGTATDEEAVAGTAADKFLTVKGLAAFWADKVGAAPETLDTIHEISAALQNNPDVIASLETLVGENKTALDALAVVVADNATAGEAALTAAIEAEVLARDAAIEAAVTPVVDRVTALETASGDQAAALETKLDKSAKASSEEIDAGVEDEKYITPLALQPKLAALSLATDTNTASIEDLVAQMTAAFNDASASFDEVPAEEPAAGV